MGLQDDEVCRWFQNRLFKKIGKYAMGKEAIWCTKFQMPGKKPISRLKIMQKQVKNKEHVSEVKKFAGEIIAGQY